MQIETTLSPPTETDCEAVAYGLFKGESEVAGAPPEVTALIASGEAKAAPGSVAVTHDSSGRRVLVVGLGPADEVDAEVVRVAGAAGAAKVEELNATSLCWFVPDQADDSAAAALIEGGFLATYKFDRYFSKQSDEPGDAEAKLSRIVISSNRDLAAVAARAATIAEAQNLARDLQNTPANDMTPSALAARAGELAEELDSVSVEVKGRDGIEALGMGAFAAVAQGGEKEEPKLIVLRYEGPNAKGPTLGFVGKAVTFDTGGISIKPAAKMAEMKFDMSGGAAVLESVGAIARLQLPVKLIAVIGSTENMPSGTAVKPGDIVTAKNGVTIEVNNTDAEGRLVLADCLCHAVDLGAERLVDMATLTGAILIALGSTFAGLFSNDDAWAQLVEQAATEVGENVWRLPLHPEYAKAMKGQYADLANVNEDRKAGSITAAEFLKRFVGEVPWAHIDIAGTAWSNGKPYIKKGGSGFGVRLLTEIAENAAN